MTDITEIHADISIRVAQLVQPCLFALRQQLPRGVMSTIIKSKKVKIVFDDKKLAVHIHQRIYFLSYDIILGKKQGKNLHQFGHSTTTKTPNCSIYSFLCLVSLSLDTKPCTRARSVLILFSYMLSIHSLNLLNTLYIKVSWIGFRVYMTLKLSNNL